MLIQQISKVRDTSNDLYKVTCEEGTWLLKRYRGQHAEKRMSAEKARLVSWREAGFSVPKIIDVELAGEQAPYLVLEWLEGLSLAEFLRSDEYTGEEKLTRIMHVIEQFHLRHLHVESVADSSFLHHDPNSGNIFLVRNKVYYLDFEAAVDAAGRSLQELMAIELAKLLRWAIRDLGRELLADVVRLTVDVYGRDSTILRSIIDLVYRRPLQVIHRYKDRRRKASVPGEITKYDIADGLRCVLSS